MNPVVAVAKSVATEDACNASLFFPVVDAHTVIRLVFVDLLRACSGSPHRPKDLSSSNGTAGRLDVVADLVSWLAGLDL